MEHENQEILKKLDKIQIDINFIKNNMVDPDCILTSEEEKILEEGLEEYRQGKTTKFEDFDREMQVIHAKRK